MDTFSNYIYDNTLKPVLVATSIKQATCIKQASIQFLKQENTLKCTCIKQASDLGACLIQVGLYMYSQKYLGI